MSASSFRSRGSRFTALSSLSASARLMPPTLARSVTGLLPRVYFAPPARSPLCMATRRSTQVLVPQ